MDWIEALILGLVQGLTEFLPVSSSGHLAIGASLFGLELDSQDNLSFIIIVHLATVLSTICVLWKDIFSLLKGVFKCQWNEETQYISKLLFSMIPIMIVGLFFKSFVEQLFDSGVFLVGLCLIITSILLSFAYYARPRKKENLSWKDVFIIGLAQALAVFPGLSRSGTTIATGIILGNNKETVAKFSFLMVLIPILGECFLDLIKGDFTTMSIPSSSLLIGFLSAFISGAFACKIMITLVKKGKLIWFAIYCLILGLISILFLS